MSGRLTRMALSAMMIVALLAGGLSACSGQSNADQSRPSSLNVYFNDPLAGLPLMTDLKAQGGQLAPALIALLDSATKSLDAAVYSVSAQPIMQALERACRRGVRVRLLLERGTFHGQPFPSCVQLQLDNNRRLMHDKFVIVDGETVWSGSTNWTRAGIYFDANNAIQIVDQAVARAYEAEFTQMFVQKRFGRQSEDNNQERFQLNGTPIEIYFSPADHPEKILQDLIKQAKSSIEIAMFAFTQNDIFQALLAAQQRGVTIQAIWDFTGLSSCQFSKVDELLQAGIGTLDADPGLLHDKYAIIDDQIVVSGSANWSASGLGTSPSGANDEDLLVIRSAKVAERYRQNFTKLYQDALRYQSDPSEPPRVEIQQFGTAGNGTALVSWRPHKMGLIDRYEVCRASSSAGPCEQRADLPGSAWYFVDRGLAPGRRYFYRVRSRSAGQWTGYSNEREASVPGDIALLSNESAKEPKYLKKTVTVRYAVQGVFQSKAGNIFLDAGTNYQTDFTGFVPSCAISHFNGSGLDLFVLQGRQIELTGELSEYNGPEIEVTEPWQLRCLDCEAPPSP